MSIKIDEIIRSKRKTIALVVTADARLVVRAPFRVPDEYIKNLVEKKKKWIMEKQQEIMRGKKCRKEKQCVDGEEFLYLGGKCALEFSKEEKCVQLKNGRLILPESEPGEARGRIIRWYKNEAGRIFDERVKFYSGLTGIKYKTFKISNAKKRWGSCSRKGSLNFAWRLVMAPLDIIDYVVVHELVHIKIANHSKEYWEKVRKIMPDYEKRRDWLRKNQDILSLFRDKDS